MRQAFVIGIILLQLFGYATAEARPPAQSKTRIEAGRKGKLAFSPLLFQHDHPADVTHLSSFQCTIFKIRDSRSLPGFISRIGIDCQLSGSLSRSRNGMLSSFYLPISRLLLFPNHYFW